MNERRLLMIGAAASVVWRPALATPESMLTFPVALPEFVVEAYTDAGDIVFEPFGGSGTTMLAAERTLRVIVTAPTSARVGEVVEIRALAQHPMETGYRRSSEGEILQRDLLRRVECRFEGELVFAADLHAAIAANPFLAFHLKLPRSGTLTITWAGDRGVAHSESVRITAT